jgi:PAS domain S-box-containing protein
MDISDESGFARARGYIFEDLALGFQWSKFQVQLAKVQPRFAVEKFEHLDEATFVTYGDHAFIKYVNRAALQLLGLADITINEAPIEAVLVQPFDFYRSLHATGALPTPTVVLSANGPLSVILNLVPENGHWVWTLTTIDCSEDPSANQSTIVSLSSLRERLASSAQPSMILSGEGIVSFNRAASDLLGFDLHAVYRKKLDMLAPTHTRELAALLAEAESKRGQECELPSILLQRRDGSLLVCSVVVREWENSEGSPARFFSAVVKITEN